MAFLLIAGQAWAAPSATETLLREKCGTCHLDGGKWQRIKDIRKTPEGWDMSIARMQVWHQLDISKEDRRALVKYFSDRQGLAPEETADYRFLTERTPNAQDRLPTEELGQMCGRCHSFGRVALQRRDRSEWEKLVHTHVGQYPSIEYSALGRDRDWWDIAREKTAAELAERYPLRTQAWARWKAKKWKPVDGTWRISGHRPGWGHYSGYMRVKARTNDRYEVRYELQYDAGNQVSGRGESVIYTGHEWRGDATLGGEAIRSIFAVDGDRISGRWFLRHADEIGASFNALRVTKTTAPTVLAVVPGLVKSGTTQRLRIVGASLRDEIDLGDGIEVLAVSAKGDDEIEATIQVSDQAAPGIRQIQVGGDKAEHPLAVYREIDSLRVEPAFGVARLGGGTVAPVSAQFEAVAYLNGADGQPDTADDIRLGALPATWKTENFDEAASALNDAAFAGHIATHGQFIPAAAGINPLREGQWNLGNLKVTASVDDGGRNLTGSGQLIVTVPRWNTPPLR